MGRRHTTWGRKPAQRAWLFEHQGVMHAIRFVGISKAHCWFKGGCGLEVGEVAARRKLRLRRDRTITCLGCLAR